MWPVPGRASGRHRHDAYMSLSRPPATGNSISVSSARDWPPRAANTPFCQGSSIVQPHLPAAIVIAPYLGSSPAAAQSERSPPVVMPRAWRLGINYSRGFCATLQTHPPLECPNSNRTPANRHVSHTLRPPFDASRSPACRSVSPSERNVISRRRLNHHGCPPRSSRLLPRYPSPVRTSYTLRHPIARDDD